MKKCAQFRRKSVIGMDMALSEHGFYAPKRFTLSPCLTNTKVRIGGQKPSNMSKNQKSFLIRSACFGSFSVRWSLGRHENWITAWKMINAGLIKRKIWKSAIDAKTEMKNDRDDEE